MYALVDWLVVKLVISKLRINLKDFTVVGTFKLWDFLIYVYFWRFSILNEVKQYFLVLWRLLSFRSNLELEISFAEFLEG